MGQRRSPASKVRLARDDRRLSPADRSTSKDKVSRETLGKISDQPKIDDDFPVVLPVTRRELDVLETYLGSLLDTMLKRPQ